MVGEILHPMAFDHQDYRTSAQTRQIPKKPELVGVSQRSHLNSGQSMLTNAEEMAMYAKSINLDDTSQRSYLRYCDDSKEPEHYIDLKNSDSEYEFKKNLRSVYVDYDDVKGMENLAANSYIGDMLVSGQYEGMHQDESALLATGVAASTLVFVESSLQVEEDVVSNFSRTVDSSAPLMHKNSSVSASNITNTQSHSSSIRSSSYNDFSNSMAITPNKSDFLLSSDERVPAIHKEPSLLKKKASARYSVELSERTRSKVDDIWNSNANFSHVGLDEGIQSNLNKYMYSQHIYGQEVDSERLSKRCVPRAMSMSLFRPKLAIDSDVWGASAHHVYVLWYYFAGSAR